MTLEQVLGFFGFGQFGIGLFWYWVRESGIMLTLTPVYATIGPKSKVSRHLFLAHPFPGAAAPISVYQATVEADGIDAIVSETANPNSASMMI